MSNLIVSIYALSAKIAMFMLVIVLAKFITKWGGMKSLDRLLSKIYKPAGYILVIAGLIHMIFSLRMISVK